MDCEGVEVLRLKACQLNMTVQGSGSGRPSPFFGTLNLKE